MNSFCILCGPARLKKWRKVDGYTVVLCQSCSLGFIHPQPTAEAREGQYRENLTSPADYYVATTDVDRETFRKRLAFLEEHMPPGRLLDVGCNVGTFLQVATQRGWQPAGIEPNPQAAQQAAQKGLPVQVGFFSPELLDTFPSDFDLINMFDVIEHFADPREAVKLAAQKIQKGGFLSLSTPNFRNPIARFFQVKPLEHLFYFDAQTLTRLLQENGFQVVRILRTTRRRDFRNILRSTTKINTGLRWLIQGAILLGAADGLSWLCASLIRDELWVLAKRT